MVNRHPHRACGYPVNLFLTRSQALSSLPGFRPLRALLLAALAILGIEGLHAAAPPVTSGLTLCLQADAINPANPGEVRTQGTNSYLQSWLDQSGSANNATQTNTTLQALYIAGGLNGKPVVRFNGGGDYYSTNLAQIAGNKTIFVVQRRTQVSAGKEICSVSNTGQFLGNNVNAPNTETKGRVGVAQDLSLIGTLNSAILKYYVRNGAAETLVVNGASASANPPDLASGNYSISCSGSPFGGDIAEVLIYNRALSMTEQRLVGLYLTAKWGLPSVLPVTAGLQLWLDADAINPNDPTQVVTSAGAPRVIAWRDLSGNGYDATQTTGTAAPYAANALNGHAVVIFGAGHMFNTLLPQIAGDKTIFIVGNRTNSSVGTEISSDAGWTGDFLANDGTNEAVGRLSVAFDLELPGTIGTPMVKSYVRASGTGTLSVDNAYVTGTFPDAATGHYTISNLTYPFGGPIGEVLIYNRALSALEQQSVQDYLQAKWSIRPAVPVTSGLTLWLDANAINPSDPNELVASGTNLYVSNWIDQSPNHLQATQANAKYQPQYIPDAIYGMPALRFNGTNSFLTTNLAQFIGQKTIIVVQKRTNNLVTGTEISSSANAGIFLGNSGTNETEGRLYVAHDLSGPGALNSVISKIFVVSGSSENLSVDYYSAGPTVAGPLLDAAGGNFTISSQNYPFPGDIGEVLIYNRTLSGTETALVAKYLNAKWSIWPETDIRSVPPDLAPPAMTFGAPAPGLRVQQTTPQYAGTGVYHTLYLPTDWQPGKKYPVIVDYAGNYLQTNDIPCTGNVENESLGYGITGGTGCIWVCMPTIGGSPLANQNTWWGDLSSTLDYCQKTVLYVCQNYGGDPSAVVLSGFSRGGIATNYLGLSNTNMADIWLGFISHAHYDGVITTWPYPNADDASALTRLNLLNGRLQFISDEDTSVENPQAYLQGTGVSMAPFSFNVLPYTNHTDIWTLRPIPLRQTARAWLQALLANRPSTYSIQGVVTSLAGTPVAGATVQSGYTHFTTTDANGNYTLAGLTNSVRTVSVTASGYTFTNQTVTISGGNVTGVNFQSSN